MATARKIVSEKTLELNVCAAILEEIRKRWPGCSKAFWMGMKQYQEARNGIDELLSNMPASRHLALQFKAPAATKINTVPYLYGMGEDQHARLALLAARRPRAVFYVLPHYNSFSRMRSDSPDLLQHTYLLDVHATVGLGSSLGGKYVHKAKSWELPPSVSVRSEPMEVESVQAKTFFSESATVPLSQSLLSTEEIRDWLRRVAVVEGQNPRVVGQRLRGFGTVCIP